MTTKKAPHMDKVTSKGVEKLEEHIDDLKNITKDFIEETAPAVKDEDPQVKWSKMDVSKFDAPVIKPIRSFAPNSKIDPKEAKARQHGWELVKVIVENKEIIGEAVEFWHNRFLGDPYLFWTVPVNIPIYIPRFVAEHLSSRKYHIFKMRDTSDMSTVGQASMTVQQTTARIACTQVGFGI